VGSMHMPLKGTEEGRDLLRVLHDIKYSNRITFEFEDLNYGNLNFNEKCSILSEEVLYYHDNY